MKTVLLLIDFLIIIVVLLLGINIGNYIKNNTNKKIKVDDFNNYINKRMLLLKLLILLMCIIGIILLLDYFYKFL